jgi:hypothetical protein
LVTLPFFVQSDQPAFRVGGVSANTKYDARYILNSALHFLPPEELRKNSDVECLVNELKASGLFEQVHAKLADTGKENVRNLVIDTVYRSDVESFVIREINLAGYQNVDKKKFNAALKRRGILVGIPLMKYFYSRLEDLIATALREAYQHGSITKGQDQPIWIAIRPDGHKGVRLTVSPFPPKCE